MKYYQEYKKYFAGIKNVRQIVVNCPFHNDKNPSLSINLEKGLFKCFACNEKGNYEQFKAKFSGEKIIIKPTKEYLPKIKFTLEEYAKIKNIPIDYLKDIWQLNNYGSGIIIPYFDEHGKITKRKIRYGNKRFEYLDKDSPISLYGLQNIQKIREECYVILVEGESDTQTLAFADYPVLGVPGANLFKEEWVKYLNGLEVIIYKEPDDGGTKFAQSIYKILININHKNRISLIGFHDEGIKDPSDLFVRCKTTEKFKEKFNQKLERRWVMKEDNSKFIKSLGNITIPSGFYLDEKGLYWNYKDDLPILICSTPFVITKITKDVYSSLEKAEISYYQNKRWYTALYSKEVLLSGKNIILNEIGIDFVTKNSAKIQDYIWNYMNVNKNVIETKTSVSHYGWYKDLFVPFASDDLVIDIPGEFNKMENAYSISGTLDEWVNIVKPLMKNDVFRTYVAVLLLLRYFEYLK